MSPLQPALAPLTSAISPTLPPPVNFSIASATSGALVPEFDEHPSPLTASSHTNSLSSGAGFAMHSTSPSSTSQSQFRGTSAPSSASTGGRREGEVLSSSRVSPGALGHASDRPGTAYSAKSGQNGQIPCTCGHENPQQQRLEDRRSTPIFEEHRNARQLPLPYPSAPTIWTQAHAAPLDTTSHGIHPSFYNARTRSPRAIDHDNSSVTSNSKRSARGRESPDVKGRPISVTSTERPPKFARLEGISSLNSSPFHYDHTGTSAPSAQLHAMQLYEGAPMTFRETPTHNAKTYAAASLPHYRSSQSFTGEQDKVPSEVENMHAERSASPSAGDVRRSYGLSSASNVASPSALSALLPLQDMTPGERDHHEAALRLASMAAASKGAEQDAGTFAAAAAALYRYPKLQAPPLPRGLSSSGQFRQADKATSTVDDSRNPGYGLPLPSLVGSRPAAIVRQHAHNGQNTLAADTPAATSHRGHAQAQQVGRAPANSFGPPHMPSNLPSQAHRSPLYNPLRARRSSPSLMSGESNSQHDRATLSDAASSASSTTNPNPTPESAVYTAAPFSDPSLLMSGVKVMTAADAAAKIGKGKGSTHSAATSQTGGTLSTVGEYSETGTNWSGRGSTIGQGGSSGSGKYVGGLFPDPVGRFG